ncbi:MAG: hypothetical protein M3010_01220, partial [Candidatus Dormibacteraeota bacterium]|nr:hypothetical protein [Candidatus Dormibacteraeota bacterium]
MLEAQRGNVTLITALTVVLLTLLILMTTGLAQTGAGSNNMQATADQGALAAAEGYLASLNDQAFLDAIQWAVEAIPNVGRAVIVVAGILAAIGASLLAGVFTAPAAAPFFAAAAILYPIGQAINGVGKALAAALKAVFSVLRQIISVVKWIASELDSALIADGNGYNGFMIPISISDAPGAKLSADDIKNKALKIEEAVVDYPTTRSSDDFRKNVTTLKDTIRLQGLIYFWVDQVPDPATAKDKDPDKHKLISQRSQATYHIPDDEKDKLRAAVDAPFIEEISQLQDLRDAVDPPEPKQGQKKPASRLDTSTGTVKEVTDVLDRVIGEFNEVIGKGGEPSGSCEPLPGFKPGCPQPKT